MTNDDSRTGSFWDRHNKRMQDPEHAARFNTEIARIRAVDAEVNANDDLTARVRDHLAHTDTLPHGLAIALVSELADEVDRLRGERDRWKARSVTAGADLDAARAALERVRARAQSWGGSATHEEWSAAGQSILNALDDELRNEAP